jgi:FKBP-type peptidyl-prolyl cis-trans isomerase FkpA
MKKAFFFLLLASSTLILNAQTNEQFTKGQNGIEYYIYPSGNAQAVKYGNFIQMHYLQIYKGAKDSVLYDSKDYSSPIQPVDSVTMPSYYYNILSKVHNGDSLVMRVLVDSIYKAVQQPVPDFFDKDKYISPNIKVLNIYETKAEADAVAKVMQQEMNRKDSMKAVTQMAVDNEKLKNYFKANNILPSFATPLGTAILVLKEGTGKTATNQDKVSVNYTVKTFSGKTVDSNTDPTFGHVQPYEVNMAQPQVIDAWKEALLLLKKGSKVKLFVPSVLAYGSRGNGPDIGPDEILLFDMEVVKIEPINAPATPTRVKPAVVNKKAKTPIKAKPKAIKKK